MRRSILLLDSPNLTKSVREFYGNEARPDYGSLIRVAKAFGSLVRAEVLVNELSGRLQPRQTGDHMVAKVLTLLKATGHQLVVAAVPQSISSDLLQIADAFIEIPVRRVHQQGRSAGTAAYPDAA